MDIYDLQFYELSMIADDPKKLSQLKERFYDSDYDDWVEEFEEGNRRELPDETEVEYSKRLKEISDWEEVE